MQHIALTHFSFSVRFFQSVFIVWRYEDGERCDLPAPKNAFRVVPGVIWRNWSSCCWFVLNASRPVHRHSSPPVPFCPPSKMGLSSSNSRPKASKSHGIKPHSSYKCGNLCGHMGLSENSVPLNPMVLLIIIPIKWLFHWEYTQHFQTNPYLGAIPYQHPPSLGSHQCLKDLILRIAVKDLMGHHLQELLDGCDFWRIWPWISIHHFRFSHEIISGIWKNSDIYRGKFSIYFVMIFHMIFPN